jgi:hypothetical protein
MPFDVIIYYLTLIAGEVTTKSALDPPVSHDRSLSSVIGRSRTRMPVA